MENNLQNIGITLLPTEVEKLLGIANNENDRIKLILSSDNDSIGFWPPGSLHTLGADGHI